MAILQTLFGDDAHVLHERDFQLVLLASLSSPLGASVVSPILERLIVPMGVADTRIGLLMAVFTAPAVVLIPLVGVLSDRYGRKPVLTSGLLLFGLAGLAIPLTTDLRVVLALRFLQGVSYTGIAPVLITSVGDIFDGPEEAAAQGLRFTAVGVSMTLFPVLSGALVAVAWQYPFLLYALAVPTALVVALRFDEPSAGGDNDADADTTRGDREDARDDASQSSGGSVRALLSLASKPDVVATLVGRAVPSFLWFVFLTYNSFVVVRLLDANASVAGVLVALASASSAVCSTQSGRIMRAAESRSVPLLVTTVLVGVGLVALAFAPSLPVATAGVVVTGAGFGLSLSLYRTAITARASVDLRGGLVSLGESTGRLGSTASPVLTGLLVTLLGSELGPEGALRWSVLAVTALGLLATVCCVVVIERAASRRRTPAASTAD